MKNDIKTNGWQVFVNPPAVTINTRDVGGVMCRWWGDGPAPAGVAMIDAATLAAAPSEWKCFHCGEAFTDEAQAALHFGKTEREKPACQFDVAALRETEALLRSYQAEDTDLHRQMYGMQSQHAIDLRREEEKGYARGLKDANHVEPAAPSEGQAIPGALQQMANSGFDVQYGGTKVAAVESQAIPTDLSKRLRNWDINSVATIVASDLHAAADEIDRYYGGMLAWKKTAEAKNAKLSEETTARVDARVAELLAELRADAVVSEGQAVASDNPIAAVPILLGKVLIDLRNNCKDEFLVKMISRPIEQVIALSRFAAPAPEAPTRAYCSKCDGEGIIHTGITDASCSQCAACDGTGYATPATEQAPTNESSKRAGA